MILRPGGHAEPAEVGGVASEWYQSLAYNFLFVFCGEQIETMPPRRRERPMPDPTVEREMRELLCSIRCYGDNTEMDS
jgi:hypothetical protein